MCNATTAAQYFHLLRRQVRRDVRKPLVLFTPKAPLRMKESRSPIEELTTGSFEEVLDDPFVADRDGGAAGSCSAAARSRGTRWPSATGAARRRRSSASSSSTRSRRSGCSRCSSATRTPRELVWLQEEPENMGPWHFVEPRIWRIKERGYDLRHVAPVESGSPATGSKAIHDQELADLLDETFDGL